MQDEHLLKELTEKHTTFKYIGPGYIMAVPARDLTEADLAEVFGREGITRADVAASSLYVRFEPEEVEPLCGAPLADGGRCRRRVDEWGQRCWQHEEVDEEV